jgi:hypothetical protein
MHAAPSCWCVIKEEQTNLPRPSARVRMVQHEKWCGLE